MDKYFKNIKSLIETNIVFERKTNLLKERNRLETYFNIGKSWDSVPTIESESLLCCFTNKRRRKMKLLY